MWLFKVENMRVTKMGNMGVFKSRNMRENMENMRVSEVGNIRVLK